MRLFYSEVLNPRKVCAAARYLDAPVDYVHVDVLGAGASRTPEFLALNPNGMVPVLQDGGLTLWESNAIMCHLSDRAGADLWPHDSRQIEVLRWLFWDAQHFSRHGGELYFQHVIKEFFGRAPDPAPVAEAIASFRSFAAVLNDHLRGRRWVVGERPSVADFALGVTLPYAERARIPLAEFPDIARWHEGLESLPGWREPFPAEPRPLI